MMRTYRCCGHRLATVVWVMASVAAFPSPPVPQRHGRPSRSIGSRRSTSTPYQSGLSYVWNPYVWAPRWFPSPLPANTATTKGGRSSIIEEFIAAYNDKNKDALILWLAEDCVWDDYDAFYQPLRGVEAIERYLRLQQAAKPHDVWVVNDVVVAERKVGFTFRTEDRHGVGAAVHTNHSCRGIATLELSSNNPRIIQKVSVVREKADKSGEAGLQILSLASSIIERTKGFTTAAGGSHTQKRVSAAPNGDTIAVPKTTAWTPPEQYFAAWNIRDMTAATAVFTDDVTYDDTAFPQPFAGRDLLQQHLQKCAACFPQSFTFVVDDLLVPTGTATTTTTTGIRSKVPSNMMALWHVENNGDPLPFTRGISMYEVVDGQKIRSGIDFVDSQPIKTTASVDLWLQSMQQKLALEPIRILPMIAWIAYVYIVFFSDNILPGANALQLEQRTWEEVWNLSLNFFLVAPSLHLPFAPVVHPVLEGVFNLLLAWAAMFAGFLSDDRRDKHNLLPMLPVVVGMQFLTSAFLLPYLATRSAEDRDDVTLAELPAVAQVTERRALGPVLALVGSYAVLWAVVGRWTEFGDLSERWTSFLDLLSMDRVGSSFIVDLVIFGLFQGWFVDDDLKRRGVANDTRDSRELRWVGKYLPFFGLAAYLALRPPYPSSTSVVESRVRGQ